VYPDTHAVTHDYKSLNVAVMIWATLVNTQTHTQRNNSWLVML